MRTCLTSSSCSRPRHSGGSRSHRRLRSSGGASLPAAAAGVGVGATPCTAVVVMPGVAVEAKGGAAWWEGGGGAA